MKTWEIIKALEERKELQILSLDGKTWVDYSTTSVGSDTNVISLLSNTMHLRESKCVKFRIKETQKVEEDRCNKHVHLQDLRTGEKEYIFSFSDWIKFENVGGAITGLKFKLSIEDKIQNIASSKKVATNNYTV